MGEGREVPLTGGRAAAAKEQKGRKEEKGEECGCSETKTCEIEGIAELIISIVVSSLFLSYKKVERVQVNETYSHNKIVPYRLQKLKDWL